MKKQSARVFTLLLGTVLLTGAVFLIAVPPLTAATADQLSQSTIDAASQAFDSAEDIFQRIKELINEENDPNADEDAEPDMEEAERGLHELEGYSDRLDELLSDLSGLPDDLDSSEGKTVLAVKDYLIMLKDMSSDMIEGNRYGITLYTTVMAMTFSDDDYHDIASLADRIYTGAEEALSIMQQTTPPVFLEIAHEDLRVRIQEFKEFAEDFKLAGEMEDWLRIYSCIYRMRRIEMVFTQCAENLGSDADLQIKQMEYRLNGPITLLHDELSRNLDLLKTT